MFHTLILRCAPLILSTVIFVTVIHDAYVVWNKHTHYHHMSSSHSLDLERNRHSIDDLQMKMGQNLHIDTQTNTCQVFYESHPVEKNEERILNQCPEIHKYPQLLHLAKHNNERDFTSRSEYKPYKEDGLFVADFYRCLNDEQMLRCAWIEITANSFNKIRAKHVKQLLHDYGHTMNRMNIKPPSFLYWIMFQLNEENSCMVCLVQILIYCAQNIFDIVVFLLIVFLCIAAVMWRIICVATWLIMHFIFILLHILIMFVYNVQFYHFVVLVVAMDIHCVLRMSYAYCSGSYNMYRLALLMISVVFVVVFVSEQSGA